MWKKFAVVGSVVAVAGLGVGGAATAWSGAPIAQAAPAAMSTAENTVAPGAVNTAIGAIVTAAGSTGATSTVPTSKPSDKQDKHRKRAGLAKRLSRVSHATWVTKDKKTGTFVTHDAVRGAVSAVAAGSITVKATDGTSETFVVTGSTKVRVGGTTGAIGQVKVGDRVSVIGTGSGPMTATRVVDRGAPGSKRTGAGKQAPQTGTSAATPTPTTTAAPTS